jgi:hypothetical protein
MPRIEMTYCRATTEWSVWFVPREPSWEPAGLWKLLGTFATFREADWFMIDVSMPLDCDGPWSEVPRS